MLIHMICRGNAFRSLIAEAYLKSLHLDGVTVKSSGTVAREHYHDDAIPYQETLSVLRRHGIEFYAKKHYGDQLTHARIVGTTVAVCVNERAEREARKLCQLPEMTIVWDVTDIGERGRIKNVDGDARKLAEDVYDEIVNNCDQLVKELRLREPLRA